ncbi:MAG: DUF2190 family protein [Kiloniellales bacterium]|nr:DUF2190 family protein [Kiloniellales bacterium]
MAKNLIQDGTRMTYENASGSTIAGGSLVVVGNHFGVAAADIPDGGVGALLMEGVFELPKVAAADIGQGQSVIWDVSNGAFDDNLATPAAGDVSGAATAWAAAGVNATVVAVKINTGVGSVT